MQKLNPATASGNICSFLFLPVISPIDLLNNQAFHIVHSLQTSTGCTRQNQNNMRYKKITTQLHIQGILPELGRCVRPDRHRTHQCVRCRREQSHANWDCHQRNWFCLEVVHTDNTIALECLLLCTCSRHTIYSCILLHTAHRSVLSACLSCCAHSVRAQSFTQPCNCTCAQVSVCLTQDGLAVHRKGFSTHSQSNRT